MRLFTIFAFALMLTCSIALAGPLAFVNPGFETGDFTGWTPSGSLVSVGCNTPTDNSVPVHSGNCSAAFGTIGSEGFISQNVATTPNTAYDLVFWIIGGGNPNAITVFWDGVPVLDGTNFSFPQWTQVTIPAAFTADAVTQFAIGLQNDPSFFHIDDIGESSPVPEPTTLFMLGAGALLIGLRRLV